MYRQDNRSRGMGGAGRNFAPVKVGEEMNVKIEAVGEKGDGVAKVKGFVLFIPGVKEGQEVKIRITRVLSKVGFAEVVGGADASTETEAPAAEEKESEQYEDSEDFGEESSESESEDEQSEEPSEEEEQN